MPSGKLLLRRSITIDSKYNFSITLRYMYAGYSGCLEVKMILYIYPSALLERCVFKTVSSGKSVSEDVLSRTRLNTVRFLWAVHTRCDLFITV